MDRNINKIVLSRLYSGDQLFSPRKIHVGFVEDKGALRDFPLAVFRLSLAIIPPMLHIFPLI